MTRSSRWSMTIFTVQTKAEDIYPLMLSLSQVDAGKEGGVSKGVGLIGGASSWLLMEIVSSSEPEEMWCSEFSKLCVHMVGQLPSSWGNEHKHRGDLCNLSCWVAEVKGILVAMSMFTTCDWVCTLFVLIPPIPTDCEERKFCHPFFPSSPPKRLSAHLALCWIFCNQN